MVQYQIFLFGLVNLTSLDLSNNSLLSLSSSSDTDFAYTFDELLQVYLSFCSIRQFPSFLRTTKKLVTLDLSRNKIQGSIPKWELEGWEQLTNLNLSYNSLTTLEQYPGQNSLETLDLRSNQLHGPLLAPPPSLAEFYMSNNNLTGEIPTWICNLSSLGVLDLSMNNLSGILLACLGNSSNRILSAVNLQRNNFHGQIPAFENVRLRSLALNDNQLEGILPRSLVDFQSYKFLCSDLIDFMVPWKIPQVVGELGSLLVLNLSYNQLTGSIPPLMGHMKALESLDLLSNKLGGRIPLELTNLTFLEVLNLTQNNLVGAIPQGKQFNTFDNDSYIWNPGLWGCPLSNKCHRIPEPPPSSFADQDDDNDESRISFIWKVAMMGYGCGTVLGLSMGYIVFTTGRPWWIVGKIERD
ncbi:hypothetical protein COLO4_35540 [Corchorus olitorius]|uniref:Leucine-rich repeat-containing N-terminal plant-type domain-containing protein n=1 Tax=Corchorus olitorius TaxID=93759 RepID=A0A1R3GFN3_9ROSI|nr:hypothetical protein COLO4_35540 [Corchorus olitorius]